MSEETRDTTTARPSEASEEASAEISETADGGAADDGQAQAAPETADSQPEAAPAEAPSVDARPAAAEEQPAVAEESSPAPVTEGAAASESPTPPPVAEAPEAAATSGTTDEAGAQASTAGETPSTESPAAAGAGDGSSDAKADVAAAGAAPKKAPPRAGSATLYRAFRSKRPLEGKVEKVIKGGYEIKVGRARGFCPHSQMDVVRVEDPETHIGKNYFFRITQVRRGGADVVLSRRALIEEERQEEAKAVRATLIEGAVMQGHIAGTAPFGAFVDLGAGVMGLVHVSELSHARVTDVAEAVKVGDTVQVKILKLDDKRGRISLSIRQAEADPWGEAAGQFEEGKIYPGTVRRTADFGVFVELAPGIEGLAPASELPPSRLGWREQLEVGTSRDWLVLSAEPKQRRISLTIPVEDYDPEKQPEIEVGASVDGKIQRVERFGVFVWLAPGKVGLMPNAATGTRPGTDLARQFPVGDPVQVDVTEISEGGRRIRLAAKGYKPKRADKDRMPTDDVSQRAKGPRTHGSQTLVHDPGSSFGTSLADKLKAALDKNG